ncbi:hypothetical protein D5086_019720 [Populus alba]|uniref:Uncharacterized protein n=1 Tax=Populus alba TaxID=43335 RepID=A0ACC4BIN4_POPAL
MLVTGSSFSVPPNIRVVIAMQTSRFTFHHAILCPHLLINGDGGAGMGESTGSNPFKGGDFVEQQWQPQKNPGAMQQQSEKQRP